VQTVEAVEPVAVIEPVQTVELSEGQLLVEHNVSKQRFIVAQDYYDVHQGVLTLVQ
jgi:hypothetical protein